MKVLQIIIGAILLFPGLCGTFYFLTGLRNLGIFNITSLGMVPFGIVGVPSIQLSCLMIWFAARKSHSLKFRKFAQGLGWFGAMTALLLFFQYMDLAAFEAGTFAQRARTVGFGFLNAFLPFMIGGLPALLLKPEPDTKT